ncbi:MAG: FG-GAP repeat domain-containing protein [Candidatus Midichloria sp.]|uniref:VCBS repeat containing protein n=1 Tax=Hyalomma marginatum TaxID=34627 RepID=A0A8S4C067_9ACAR|nr:VCBS repeat containing protein [Hyalomma marginatum]CAG7589423.1 VCBS repeat containing protein [Hyalomma marginatum]
MGNGGGTFKPATFYNVGSGPVGVDTRDFNNDGKIDIVNANRDLNSVSVLLGNGDGTFKPAPPFIWCG